jgi:hypothetical protein
LSRTRYDRVQLLLGITALPEPLARLRKHMVHGAVKLDHVRGRKRRHRVPPLRFHPFTGRRVHELNKLFGPADRAGEVTVDLDVMLGSAAAHRANEM